jgi:hypothetical protein
VRFTPEIIGDLAGGLTGVELAEVMRLGPRETFMAVCPPLAAAALAMPRVQLEAFLGFRLRTWHIENLERWSGLPSKPAQLLG